jgi:polysaccharide biosynthesis/export protein
MNKQVMTTKPRIKKAVVTVLVLMQLASGAVGAQSLDRQSANALLSAQRTQVSNGEAGLPSISRQDTQGQASRSQKPKSRAAIGEKDTFESYVEQVTGKNIDIFGKDLFTNVPDTFAAVDAVQVNPEYIIGSGDELQIRGWGMVDIDVSTTVDRSGTIYIPRVGAVRVAGVKYRDLQDYLKKAVGRIYANFDLTASIAQTRAVQVYVVGHAARPGTYTLSAMSTLLNALFVSGGPDASGTMRNIQVKRGSSVITTFDLYDMLVKGDKSRDVGLQDGDVIYIPEVGPLVSITGDVKKQAIFELKGAASIADAINWAGGGDSAAEQKPVIVEKNVNNQYQAVAELTASKEAITSRLGSIPLLPTDVVRIFSPSAVPVQVQVQNEYVRVAGEIRQSGVYQIKKGETLRELISRLGGPTENGYLYATVLNRESVRRAQQARLNEVAERFEREVESAATSQIAGTTDLQNITAVNAEVDRQRRLAAKLRTIKAEGRIVLELPGGDAEVKHLPDIALQDGDSIYIPRKSGTVDVLGAVFQQNSFIYRPQRAVSNYLEMAGGPTGNADKSEIYLIHADGTTQSARSTGLFRGIGGIQVSAGDSIVVPETIERSSWTRNLKEWTTILYQFGLGAAGLKALQ